MKRFTLRWDEIMGCYRVSIPRLDGPIEVVEAEGFDVAIQALEKILMHQPSFPDYTPQIIAVDALNRVNSQRGL